MKLSRSPIDRSTSRTWIPIVVLAGTLLLTGIAAFYVQKAVDAKDRARFERSVQEISGAIDGRLDTYVTLLRSGTGLFAASNQVEPDEFHKFVTRLELARHYPGIQGIGYSAVVPRDQKAQLVAMMRRSGYPDFAIRPEGDRPESHSIIYLEPLDRRNRVAIGYDMFTEPMRREAMEQARDTGLPVASGRVTLVQEIDSDKQSGFLIYMPVYRNGSATDTVDERRAALVGFVYAPFRAGDLLRGTLASLSYRGVNFQVYDGAATSPENLLYDSAAQTTDADKSGARYNSSTKIDIAERPWALTFSSGPEFDSTSPFNFALLTLLGGVILSLVLFGITTAQTRSEVVTQRAIREFKRSAVENALLLDRESKARAEAEESNRLKDEFLATVSHELRTPLTAIMGWARMLDSEQLNEATAARAIQTILRNAKTQAQIVDDILDVSRIVSGNLNLNLEPTELVPVIDAAVNVVRPAAEAKGISLMTDFDSRPSLVSADGHRLQQIVWNLLSNAVKFTPEHGFVQVRVRESNAHVEIEVSDNGDGIRPNFLPHVFERFRQADSSTTRLHGGLGLGLAIVRHLVELHGGAVRAESEGEGKGATFTVTLPVRAATGKADGAAT